MQRPQIERKQANDTFLTLVLGRCKGLSEEEIARERGFATPETLYQQLKNWEFPDWLVYKDPPSQEQHAPGSGQERQRRDDRGKSSRKARGTEHDAVYDLPPAADAVGLFLELITRRTSWETNERKKRKITLPTLEDDVRKLYDLREQLSKERFLSSWWSEDETEHYHRDMYFSQADWEKVCKEHNVDPAVEDFDVPLGPIAYPVGAATTPWKGLVVLIAVYFLRRRRIYPLLEALHPDPASVDRAGLEKDIGKLRRYAGRIAMRVRGGTVRKGARTAGVSQRDLILKWIYIDPLHRAGKSDQEILDELVERGHVEEHHTLAEINRLRSLKLPEPSE